MRALGAQLHRPERPGSQRRALVRRLGHDLELVHGERLLAVAGAEAIGAGIAAADDDDALAGGENLGRGITVSPWQRLFCCGRNSMAKWMPLSSRPGIFRSRGCSEPPGEKDGVEVAAEIFHGDRFCPPARW